MSEKISILLKETTDLTTTELREFIQALLERLSDIGELPDEEQAAQQILQRRAELKMGKKPSISRQELMRRVRRQMGK